MSWRRTRNCWATIFVGSNSRIHLLAKSSYIPSLTIRGQRNLSQYNHQQLRCHNWHSSVPNITKPVGLPFSLAPPEIQSVITKDYWGTDIICKNGTPQQFFFDGGFANIKGNELSWHYYVKDHLGSNRIVQDEKGKVGATYNFYPFGGYFDHCEELFTHNISQSFTFQGKEYTGMNFMINHKGKPTKTQVTNFRDQLEKKYFGNKIGDTPTN